MKTQKYLITFIKKETSEIIYTYTINATDLNNAQQIADDLTNDYKNELCFEIATA